MNYNFEYIDIILLAMIAGFIFLRLRGILGRRTGYEENLDTNFPQDLQRKKNISKDLDKLSFDEKEKNDFLNGAKIAYETIITNFANGNLKNIKLLLDKKVYNQFNEFFIYIKLEIILIFVGFSRKINLLVQDFRNETIKF